jgi:hypothetical protein
LQPTVQVNSSECELCARQPIIAPQSKFGDFLLISWRKIFMRTYGYRALISLFLTLSLAWVSVPPRSTTTASASPVSSSHVITFERPPLRFEMNEGQSDSEVRFTARENNGIAFLTSDGTVLQLTIAVAKPDSKAGFRKAAGALEESGFASSSVRLKAIGANSNARMIGLERLPGVTNYLIGNDRRKWRTGVAGYGKVKHENVYPGIDLIYYGNQEGRLEYDFIVAPGADPNQIAVSIEGAQGVEIDQAGDLIISAATGKIRQPAPRIYQEVDGQRHQIAGQYRLLDGETEIGNRQSAIGNPLVTFALADYDASQPLVIDPEVVYATYLGGSSTSTVGNEGARSVAVDGAGAVYLVGTALSNFPTMNPQQGALRGFINAFITKLDAGGQMVYSTYLGGSAFDEGAVIKVDETGAAYVGGTTSSSDFPTVNPIQGRRNRNDAFITKLSSSGSQIVYSTYLGGEDNEGVSDLALDAQKNIFVAGNVIPALGTPANDFPTINPIQATHGGGTEDGFVSVIDPTGGLRFSTYFGGNGEDILQSIDLNPGNGELALGFFTDSTNLLPGSSSGLALAEGAPSAGVVRIVPEGDALYYYNLQKLWLTFLGTLSPDKIVELRQIKGVLFAGDLILMSSLLTSGNPGVFSKTESPAQQMVQPQAGGGLDIRMSALDQNLNETKTGFFGGSGEDRGSALATDAQGAAYIIGHTRSTNLPTVNPLQANHAGGNAFDGFLAVLHPQTFEAVFATYLGGTGSEFLTDITVDPQGNIYVVGETFGGFPNPTPGALQNQLRGRTDAFIIKISPVAIATNPDFAISSNPARLTVARGQQGTVAINVNRIGGFDGEVTVTISDPKPKKVKFKPAELSTTGGEARFKVVVKAGGVVGEHNLVFTATDRSGRSRTATMKLIIQ